MRYTLQFLNTTAAANTNICGIDTLHYSGVVLTSRVEDEMSYQTPKQSIICLGKIQELGTIFKVFVLTGAVELIIIVNLL